MMRQPSFLLLILLLVCVSIVDSWIQSFLIKSSSSSFRLSSFDSKKSFNPRGSGSGSGSGGQNKKTKSNPNHHNHRNRPTTNTNSKQQSTRRPGTRPTRPLTIENHQNNENNINYENNNNNNNNNNPPPTGKNYATQTILGQNIIRCRDFSIDSRKDFSFLGSYKSVNQMPIYPLPEIAFIGRSNVGKSSLLNCITGSNKHIAVQSKIPGRTQSINMFKCCDATTSGGGGGGDLCIFTDLPGYGYAKLSKTAQEEISLFVNAYLKERRSLRLTVVLIDARREPLEMDADMMAFLQSIDMPYAVVATKVDKLKKHEVEEAEEKLRHAYSLPPGLPILFSAETGQGKREVWKNLRDALLGQGLYADFFAEEDEEDDDEEEEEEREIIEEGLGYYSDPEDQIF